MSVIKITMTLTKEGLKQSIKKYKDVEEHPKFFKHKQGNIYKNTLLIIHSKQKNYISKDNFKMEFHLNCETKKKRIGIQVLRNEISKELSLIGGHLDILQDYFHK